MVSREEAALAAASDTVKVSLRVQFMENAEDYLLSYREKLVKASEVMRQMDLNRKV